jgi:hypothetical protein
MVSDYMEMIIRRNLLHVFLMLSTLAMQDVSNLCRIFLAEARRQMRTEHADTQQYT